MLKNGMDMDKQFAEIEKQERRERLNRQSRAYEDTFTLAAWRSVFVRIMKIGLPLVGLCLIAALFILPNTNDRNIEPTFEVEEVKRTLGKIEMTNPEYKAYDENKNPYTVTADKALRNPDDESVIKLDKPTADVTLKNGGTLDIQANKGDYAQDDASLVLKGDVLLKDSNGYDLSTQGVSVDLKTGNAHSSRDVFGQGPKGTVQSEGMTIEDKGNRVIFEGKSKVILNSTSLPTQESLKEEETP